MIFNFVPHSRPTAVAGHAFAWILDFELFEVRGLGRADGPHRTIERFRFESLNRRIMDDPPYQARSVQSAPTQVGVGAG